MADFTIWRFHECNANFLNTVFGDKKRLVLYFAAFFLLLWNKAPAAETAPYFLAASVGTFGLMLLLEQAVRKYFGGEAALTACWLLITCPGYLFFAKNGEFSALGAMLSCAAVLLTVLPETAGSFKRYVYAGILCGIPAWFGMLYAGLTLPLVCIILSGKKLHKRWLAGILTGTLLAWLSQGALLYFYRGCTFADCFAVYTGAENLPQMPVAVLSLFSVCFWAAFCGLAGLKHALKADCDPENGKFRKMAPVLTVSFGAVAGTLFYGIGALLPFLAALSGCALICGAKDVASAQEKQLHILLKILVWLQRLAIVAALAAPVIFALYFFQELPDNKARLAGVLFWLIRVPLAGILLGFWHCLAAYRLKKGKAPLFTEKYPELDTVLPGSYIVMLLLMD